MAGSEGETTDQKSDQVATGVKHQTEHESSKAKRTKQVTLEETLERNEGKDSDNGNVKQINEGCKTEETLSTSESAVEPSREPDVLSSILEKGIIYFFMRGRVGMDKVKEVNDIARSYILLRPVEKDVKLGAGPIGDAGTTRLLALPKKVLPMSGKDRFMVFVEKSGASYDEIKKDFLSSSDYETKTAGTRHSPAATPVGEGVYAITTTGRESHLAYILTLPEKLDTVQKELGIKEKGSFILSTKNPNYTSPANAQLPQGPEYPKEIIGEFRSLRWLPSKPAHLDYINSQMLLIGESAGLSNAMEPQKKDQEKGKEGPKEVLEHFEEEDLKRMRDLPGDQSASVFADLQAHAKDYPKLQTTF